jgi:hypothetical protein
VPHPLNDPCLDLRTGELWGAAWGISVAGWLASWPEAVAIAGVGSGLARYETKSRLVDGGHPTIVSWTFEDGRLVSIRLSPAAGRRALAGLVEALRLESDELRDEGDGLAHLRVGRTRVDVDELDGTILLEEEPQ